MSRSETLRIAILAACTALAAAPALGSEPHHSFEGGMAQASGSTRRMEPQTRPMPAGAEFFITRTPCTPGITLTSPALRPTAA